MKKFISFLTLVLLVSSCGNHLSITKRHYTKGFYVHGSKSLDNATFAKVENKNNKLKKTQPTVVSFLNDKKQQTPELWASIKNNTPEKSDKKYSYRSQLKKHVTDNNTRSVKTIFATVKNKSLFADEVKKQSKSSSEGDINLIILVLLAIFIPPLAVYLKSRATNKWFWVTLVLCLLSFSYFIFVFGSALWFAAMLIAFLYIFDIIH